MRRWFGRLSIHRKLVVTALIVTTAALVLANAGLVGVDLWRYRWWAVEQATATAQVIAENVAAAVTFKDPDAAAASLETVRTRPSARRGCLYLPDGALYASAARSPDVACPAALPSAVPWNVVAGAAPIVSNGRRIGTVYVEDELVELRTRVVVASLTSVVMLVIAGTAAFALANRLQRWVSTPITRLAAAARAIRPGGQPLRPVLPDADVPEDEVGDLARAFTEMLRRVERADAEREELLIREREASRLKDEFLAAVSHELRTPLNAIVGWAQVLSSTTPSPEITARGIASIARNAKAQTRVINDLVDVSRIITGKLHIRFDPVDLREVTESAIDAVRSSAEDKGVALTTTMPGDLAYVSGDRDRLLQIIGNLLSNAVKFTGEGGVIAVALSADGSAYELRIADSGIGIEPAFLPHVFDRFRQADGTTTRQHAGLGLGLAIVKELTELHGGAVRAASPGAGRGATFTVRLPKLPGLHAPEPAGEPARPRGVALAGIEVLAVDDNPDALEVVAASLSSNGASVRVADSGEHAIAEWDRAPAQVLICDLAMPGLDGFAVLRAIRQRTAAAVPVPAIALTAYASTEFHARTRDAGFEAHLAKPFDEDELVRTILAVLGRT